MKTTKTIFLATTIVLLSIFTTSCIPTTPVGGNPTPANQFDININDQGLNNQDPNPDMWTKSKILVVDGDSIKFELRVSWNWAPFEMFNILFKSSASDYQFLITKDFSNPTSLWWFADFPGNINIPSSLDTTYRWVNAEPYYYDYGNLDFLYGYQVRGGAITPLSRMFTIPANEDRYFVFRKIKNTDYQYYWVKVKYIPTILPYGGQNGCGYDFTVLSVKYQMNSITTGQ